MTDEDEVLDDLELLSPLTALDPDEVERLSPAQRKFLLEYVTSGSIALARTSAGIKSKTVTKWMADPQFKRLFDVVKSPLTFALALAQAIILRATVEHYKLLQHPRISIRQWAIDKAYNMPIAKGGEKERDVRLTSSEIKQIIENQMKEIEAPILPKAPFEFVDAEVRTVEEGS